MIDQVHLLLALAGSVVIIIGAFFILIQRHEVRELKVAAEKHVELRLELNDLRRLTLNAINGRAGLEADVRDVQAKVRDLDARVSALEGL